jgi:hypothetical protein
MPHLLKLNDLEEIAAGVDARQRQQEHPDQFH